MGNTITSKLVQFTLSAMIALTSPALTSTAQANEDEGFSEFTLTPNAANLVFYGTKTVTSTDADAVWGVGGYALVFGLGNGVGANIYAGPELTFAEYYFALMPFIQAGNETVGVSLQSSLWRQGPAKTFVWFEFTKDGVFGFAKAGQIPLLKAGEFSLKTNVFGQFSLPIDGSLTRLIAGPSLDVNLGQKVQINPSLQFAVDGRGRYMGTNLLVNVFITIN